MINNSKTDKKTKQRAGKEKSSKPSAIEDKAQKVSPKNTQEKFLALLATAKKTFDYKDESKDFKQKREKLQALFKL